MDSVLNSYGLSKLCKTYALYPDRSAEREEQADVQIEEIGWVEVKGLAPIDEARPSTPAPCLCITTTATAAAGNLHHFQAINSTLKCSLSLGTLGV